MLRSGTASWTREYQAIEEFGGASSSSPSSSVPGSPFPLPLTATTTTTTPSQEGRRRERDQEPLLPNREPSPGPTSAFEERGRVEGEEHQHAPPGLVHSTSHPPRLSPSSTFSSHSSYSTQSSSHAATSLLNHNAQGSVNSHRRQGSVNSQSQNYNQQQHQHQAYPPLSHSSHVHAHAMSSNAHHDMHHNQHQGQPQPRPSTSSIGKTSPLNPGSASAPTTPGLPPHPAPFARPGSRGSLNLMAAAQGQQPQGLGGQTGGSFSRMANEELRALSGPYPNGLTSGLPPAPGSRGSMILYRRADSFTSPPLPQGPMAPEEGNRYTLHEGFLPPPPIGGGGHGGSNRGSMYSVSGDSIASMGMGDSKYPPSLFAGGTPGTPGTPIRTTGSGLRGPFQGAAVHDGRGSVWSDGRTSVAFSGYGGGGGGGGLVAYAYDPDEEDLSEDDEDDWLHDPEVAYPKGKHARGGSKAPPPPPPKGAAGIQHSNSVSGSSAGGHSDAVLKGKGSTVGGGGVRGSGEGQGATATGTGEKDKRGLRIPHPSKVPPHYRGTASWSWRGVVNITTLIALLASLLALFMVYPMIRDKMDSGVNARITGNTRINATGQAVEGDGSSVGGGGSRSSSSTSRTTTRELNPGGVTFNRRGVLFDLPAATPTVSVSVVTGRSPAGWAVASMVPCHGKDGEGGGMGNGKDGKEPAFRWMRNGKLEEGVKPWPVPPPSPVRGVEMPVATRFYTLDEEDLQDDGEGEEWVVVERPPKYGPGHKAHEEEEGRPNHKAHEKAEKEKEEGRPKSLAPTVTPTRSESGAPEVTAALWGGGSGEEVLECGEACEKEMNERW